MSEVATTGTPSSARRPNFAHTVKEGENIVFQTVLEEFRYVGHGIGNANVCSHIAAPAILLMVAPRSAIGRNEGLTNKVTTLGNERGKYLFIERSAVSVQILLQPCDRRTT